MEPYRLPGILIAPNGEQADCLVARRLGSGGKEYAEEIVLINVCTQRGSG